MRVGEWVDMLSGIKVKDIPEPAPKIRYPY